MSERRLSVRITKSLEKRLKSLTRSTGRSESEIVRAALENYRPTDEKPAGENCYEMAKRLGLIGCARGMPSDLSTNPKYMEGFGRD
jgi:hypothetical protein